MGGFQIGELASMIKLVIEAPWHSYLYLTLTLYTFGRQVHSDVDVRRMNVVAVGHSRMWSSSVLLKLTHLIDRNVMLIKDITYIRW